MILPYRQLVLEDLLSVVPVEPIQDDPLSAYEMYRDNREAVESTGYTVLLESRILLCVGVHEVSPTCGHVWATFDRDISKHLRRVVKTLRHLLDLQKFPRLQTYVREGTPNGFELVELFGFALETPWGMRKLLGEDTWYQFSRV